MQNLITNISEIPKNKSVFVFDLDGTLAESKVDIDSEMGDLLVKLMDKGKVAIIGGAKFEQLESQLPEQISKNSSLLLLPLDGGSFYAYKDDQWDKVYSQEMLDKEKKLIFEFFEKSFVDAGYIRPTNDYGDIIEDRGGQITFSALGQNAPLGEKEKWAKENNDVRLKIQSRMKEYLPDMEVKVAGITSIDVTPKGIDKKFGIEQIIKYLNTSKEEVIFFGDSFDVEGNDYPVLESGVTSFKVESIENTKKAIQQLLD